MNRLKVTLKCVPTLEKKRGPGRTHKAPRTAVTWSRCNGGSFSLLFKPLSKLADMYQPKFLIISLPFQTHPCDVSQGSSFLCVFRPRKTTGFSGNYFLFKSKVFSFLRSLLDSTLFPRYYKSRKRNRLLLRKIYNNEESTLLGYSVAFGSTGCSGSDVHRSRR